jgi:hypothetical protein
LSRTPVDLSTRGNPVADLPLRVVVRPLFMKDSASVQFRLSPGGETWVRRRFFRILVAEGPA